MVRITIKNLEDRINTINSLLGKDIRLWKTTGCGVDIKIDNHWISEYFADKNLTNKQAMAYLDREYGEAVKKRIIELNKEGE